MSMHKRSASHILLKQKLSSEIFHKLEDKYNNPEDYFNFDINPIIGKGIVGPRFDNKNRVIKHSVVCEKDYDKESTLQSRREKRVTTKVNNDKKNEIMKKLLKQGINLSHLTLPQQAAILKSSGEKGNESIGSIDVKKVTETLKLGRLGSMGSMDLDTSKKKTTRSSFGLSPKKDLQVTFTFSKGKKGNQANFDKVSERHVNSLFENYEEKALKHVNKVN